MEARHPIESIMETTMESIRDMIDVDTVIGEAILTQDGSTIIPISRVSFGFVAGGGEYRCGTARQLQADSCNRMPFAGGTGAGVTVQPIGFLVSGESSVRMLPAQLSAPADRMIELVPQLLCEIKNMLRLKNEQTAAHMTPPQSVPMS